MQRLARGSFDDISRHVGEIVDVVDDGRGVLRDWIASRRLTAQVFDNVNLRHERLHLGHRPGLIVVL